MLLDILLLLGGLGLILGGASVLTDGASALARRLGMSDLVVGLTVVAFGTSAPELAISVLSAIDGKAGLAIGNVVGSNMFNVCVIIGITALVRPIKVSRSVMSDQIPLVILSAIALLAMGNGPLLGVQGPNVLTRIDGILLLLFFAIFMRYTFAQAKQADATETSEPIKERPLWLALVMVVGGLGALIGGGEAFVEGASAIASAMGVSDAVIGLTIVAVGTSLPELAASLAAALKGHTDMAVGNVIGSNIFNIFLVLGAASTIEPLPFGAIGNVDLLVLIGACAAFWLVGRVGGHRVITRSEGALLTATYVGYMVWLVATATV